ncbi:sodium/glutamate symporter [Vibrio breoganii]|uniref:sodium/glutamate symporter n=2 Tax=Vibrio breoganii TaxID=553239 RepID=UPI0002E42145|nr:sodium/glutamate symporter [Vibrio breoganii]OEF82465.1 sodium/glutamate symporter [Vibrio breoganii 1C10]PMG03028.1 sodium/glutamate symporter [Vibrio breoganii]PMG77668.1 sodium/glutamate symporter [Vibrio breoganii]PMJ47015.1 sodium/glutamate symporter [Vibrio breoganii]PMK58415.1 sodium/glutamate symporter [Vibrio breoganii]
MTTTYTIGSLESFLIAIFVLFLGQFINRRVPFLKKYKVPEPIVGGLIIAIAITVLHFNGINLDFTLPLEKILMLMFFTTVGLSASYSQLLKGGKKVFIFLGVASVYIIIQNAIGVSLASMMDLNPLMGLVAGSITLSGGHGTGAAWAATFDELYGLKTLEFAMASATFGLIVGGLIGGPVAQRRINKHNLISEYGDGSQHHEKFPDVVTYNETEEDKVTPRRVIETMFMVLVCVVGATYIKEYTSGLGIGWLKGIPDFVFALFLGVILTNIYEFTGAYKFNTDTVDIIGTVSLALFLAMALMSLKLWEIFDLAMPLLVILGVQTCVLAVFAYNITFRVMGSNYDAAIITGGHCGFGMGATPTAVMNMGSLVNHYGPSPQAFMVVPIVGAFFIDIVNLLVLQGYIAFIG